MALEPQVNFEQSFEMALVMDSNEKNETETERRASFPVSGFMVVKGKTGLLCWLELRLAWIHQAEQQENAREKCNTYRYRSKWAANCEELSIIKSISPCTLPLLKPSIHLSVVCKLRSLGREFPLTDWVN